MNAAGYKCLQEFTFGRYESDAGRNIPVHLMLKGMWTPFKHRCTTVSLYYAANYDPWCYDIRGDKPKLLGRVRQYWDYCIGGKGKCR